MVFVVNRFFGEKMLTMNQFVACKNRIEQVIAFFIGLNPWQSPVVQVIFKKTSRSVLSGLKSRGAAEWWF